MLQSLEQAIRVIKSTMHSHNNDNFFPYFFIVGAGISAPEIPTSKKIIERCKTIVKDSDEEYYQQCDNESKQFVDDNMKYYSTWIEYAFPNRIDRSAFLKSIIVNSKISSANLMLAQILNSKQFSNTVFTTNFDDSIKKALELMGTKEFFVAENTMDNLIVNNQTKEIQIVHVHGTFNFYDCANLEKEIDNIASQSGVISSYRVLSSFLSNQAPIIVGYSGWENDVIMKCLEERLSYPTPLQYIWVCYDKESYIQLPEWIKKNESVIFVIPEKDEKDCNDTVETNAFLGNRDDSKTIDATLFFRRIISELKINVPLIFSNPYLYYSEKINTLLPENEDVLHLRHWAQRMKLLESNENDFEKLVRKIENAFISKDYAKAQNILLEIKELELSEANAEFVCCSLIEEFIRDEDAISSFEQRLNFHLCALDFIDKHFSQLVNKNSLTSTMKLVLFTKYKHSEKDKIIALLEKVQAVSSRDERLLAVELISLGMKSSLVDRSLKISILEEILERCPEDLHNKQFVYLRFKALLDLSLIIDSKEAGRCVEEAKKLLLLLNDNSLSIDLSYAESELLLRTDDGSIKKILLDNIVKTLLDSKGEIDNGHIRIASNVAKIGTKELNDLYDLNVIERLYLDLIARYKPELSDCEDLLKYSQCCSFLCLITTNLDLKYKYCNKVFDLQESFPHECRNFLITLFAVANVYFSLPNLLVSDQIKSEKLLSFKENKKTSPIFYNLLDLVIEKDYITDTCLLRQDIDYMETEKAKVKKAYNLYKEGKHCDAEQLFTELISCKIFFVSEMAKTNLSFMIRRNETQNKLTFLEIVSKIKNKRAIDLMNIMLYYISQNDTADKQYLNARESFKRSPKDELKEVIECWSDINLVGEAESLVALALIEELKVRD